MRIKMTTTAAGPEGVYAAGQVVVVSEELGKAFVNGGYAVEEKAKVSAPPAISKKKAGKREKATRKPSETATLPDADKEAA